MPDTTGIFLLGFSPAFQILGGTIIETTLSLMHRSRQIEHPNVDVAGPQAEAGISRLKAGRPAADKSYRSKSSTVLRPDGNRSQVTNLKQVCSLCLIWRLTHILDGLLVHQQLQRAAWLAWEHNIAEDWVRWETPVCECLQVPGERALICHKQNRVLICCPSCARC